MKIKNLPKKYEPIWSKSLKFLKKGRPGDDTHAKEVVETILNYTGKMKVDFDVLVPVAMMHDIGHSAILPKHFKYITGPEKYVNGKLVHILAGAKIADDILASLEYDTKKKAEIVDIISMHDADQLKIEKDVRKIYDSVNKKIFHDFDSLDRYNERRLKDASRLYKNRNKLLDLLESMLDNFFYAEFRKIAEDGMRTLRGK
jgi:hypothetical protein